MYKYKEIYKSDKMTYHGYERYYDMFLIPYKNKKIKLLEIGVLDGNSIKMWCDIFKNGHVYGFDINSKFKYNKATIINGNQNNKNDLNKLIEEIKKATIIIDDGSHKPEHQLFTFNYLFKNLLDYGGLYIIEDIETSYWKNGNLYGNKINAGYNSENNIVNIFKNILDIINSEYLLSATKQQIYENNKIDKENLKCISSITFGMNCIIIKKKSKIEQKIYGNRKYKFEKFLTT